MKKVTLINPNLIVQKSDKFTTGIVYMPISLAYVSSSIDKEKFDVVVIDLFGEDPNNCNEKNNFAYLGKKINNVNLNIFEQSDYFIILGSKFFSTTPNFQAFLGHKDIIRGADDFDSDQDIARMVEKDAIRVEIYAMPMFGEFICCCLQKKFPRFVRV